MFILLFLFSMSILAMQGSMSSEKENHPPVENKGEQLRRVNALVTSEDIIMGRTPVAP